MILSDLRREVNFTTDGPSLLPDRPTPLEALLWHQHQEQERQNCPGQKTAPITETEEERSHHLFVRRIAITLVIAQTIGIIILLLLIGTPTKVLQLLSTILNFRFSVEIHY